MIRTVKVQVEATLNDEDFKGKTYSGGPPSTLPVKEFVELAMDGLTFDEDTEYEVVSDESKPPTS
jgi:hypothetical protein